MRRTLFFLSLATLYLTLSGFECASSEMSTARVARQRKDNAAAEAALKKEVAARPTNSEAWSMLGDIYEEQARYVEMSNAYKKALTGTPPLDNNQRLNIAIKEYNAWNSVYNRSIQAYDKKNYDVALGLLDTADMLRPGVFQSLYIRGVVLDAANRSSEANQAYARYIDLVSTDVDQGLKAGLALGLTPKQVEAKLGAPTRDSSAVKGGGYMVYAPKNLWVYFRADTAGPKVEGWKYYTDATPELLRTVPVSIESQPWVILGAAAYEEGASNAARYNDALRYLQALGKLDPNRSNAIGAGRSIAEIYKVTNRIDEARALYEAQIRENPRDPSLYIEYGNLLFNMKSYSGSAENFRKVLDLGLSNDDENKTTALFNLGAVYKNWGAALQDSIRKVSNSRPTNAQIDVYQKPLRESLKYFEQLREIRQDDYALLAELANLYDVLGESAKRNQMVSRLEGLRAANENKVEYWRAMARLYAVMGDSAKAEAADKKARELQGR